MNDTVNKNNSEKLKLIPEPAARIISKISDLFQTFTASLDIYHYSCYYAYYPTE